MILDALFVILVPIFEVLVMVAVVPAIALANGLAALLELVIGIFSAGFELGRLSYPSRVKVDEEGAPRPLTRTEKAMRAIIAGVALLIVAGMALVFFVGTTREVTLEAVDGYTLPYAGVVIETRKGEVHRRSDSAGNIKVPRLGLRAVTVNDPRYIAKTWPKAEVGRVLVVERSVLGSALDKAADLLLKKKPKSAEQ